MAIKAPHGSTGVTGGAVNKALTVNPNEYPLTAPEFQLFQAQQYLGLCTGLIYSEKTPAKKVTKKK
jgi:hypothetical protein